MTIVAISPGSGDAPRPEGSQHECPATPRAKRPAMTRRLRVTQDFGPLHDRLELTKREIRSIDEMERTLTTAGRALTARTRLLIAWVPARRRAMWLLPVASIGVVVTLSMSLVAAAAFAILCAVCIGALVSEVTHRHHTRSWRVQRRRDDVRYRSGRLQA